MVFTLLIEACNHHQHNCRTSLSSQGDTTFSNGHLQSPQPSQPTPSPRQPLAYFQFPRSCLFWTFPVNELVCALLWVTPFTQHHAFKVYPCRGMCHSFIPFQSQTIFHEGWVIFIHSHISWWISGCFYGWLLSVVRLLRTLCMSFCVAMFHLGDTYLGVKLPGHVVTLRLCFWGTDGPFSRAAAPLHRPGSSVWGTCFLLVLTKNYSTSFLRQQPQ